MDLWLLVTLKFEDGKLTGVPMLIKTCNDGLASRMATRSCVTYLICR
jgi:hypothetical protein